MCSQAFLSTPSARRATSACAMRVIMPRYFYPRPPRGGRPPTGCYAIPLVDFYPRPPRGGRRNAVCFPADHIVISIHALREEGDPQAPALQCAAVSISIHALREEGDQAAAPEAIQPEEFLSTPSARRATVIRMIADVFTLFLSTPSARRATVIRMIADVFTLFLSTPSARRATGYRSGVKHGKLISIHALREEGDTCGPSPLDNSI